jgi:DICT domain-containing protein
MLPELLRFSSAAHLIEQFPKEIRDLHWNDIKSSQKVGVATVASEPVDMTTDELWAGWQSDI